VVVIIASEELLNNKIKNFRRREKRKKRKRETDASEEPGVKGLLGRVKVLLAHLCEAVGPELGSAFRHLLEVNRNSPNHLGYEELLV